MNSLGHDTAAESAETARSSIPAGFYLAGLTDRRRRLLEQAGVLESALAFIRGDFEIEGDIFAAIRWKVAQRPRFRDRWAGLVAGLAYPAEHWLQSRGRAAWNIRFHYDRPPEFYRNFLDSRLVYSCGYFREGRRSLEEAQVAKLDHICRKLDLQPRERFLDIGCGWGALVLHAAGRYGAHATGCTLSRNQYEYATRAGDQQGSGAVCIREEDYRALTGRFDKIASVGMFEHVGRRRLKTYFRKVYGLLEEHGLFLNHGIARPQTVRPDGQTLLLRRKVFPGGELARLSEVIRAAEETGFEPVDIENLRPHYALTCRAWVRNLLENREAASRAAGRETWRTWLLYLAASAVSFEDGTTEIYQVLMSKRFARGGRKLTRDYIYR